MRNNNRTFTNRFIYVRNYKIHTYKEWYDLCVLKMVISTYSYDNVQGGVILGK